MFWMVKAITDNIISPPTQQSTSRHASRHKKRERGIGEWKAKAGDRQQITSPSIVTFECLTDFLPRSFLQKMSLQNSYNITMRVIQLQHRPVVWRFLCRKRQSAYKVGLLQPLYRHEELVMLGCAAGSQESGFMQPSLRLLSHVFN